MMETSTKILIWAIVIGILVFGLTGCGTGINAGNGKKIGQVVQIGSHGILCSTYEGKLVRGGFNGGSGVMGAEFNFTVSGQDLFEKLTQAMDNQTEIEVSYSKVQMYNPCFSESGYFVTGFRPLAEAKKSETPKEQKMRQLQEELERMKALP